MYLPKADTHRRLLEAKVQEVAKTLGPDIVSVTPTFEDNWMGEPAVFFMIILTDAASERGRLLDTATQASRTIEWNVEPLEEWGVLPYFNFRLQSEQAKLDADLAVTNGLR